MSEPTFQAQPITKDAKSYAIYSLNASTECITTNRSYYHTVHFEIFFYLGRAFDCVS